MNKGGLMITIAALLVFCLGGGTALGAAPFADVDESWTWARDAVLYLVDEEIISGFPDGTFRPAAQVTRAQFVRMLVSAAGLDLHHSAVPTFGDTGSHWVTPYLEAAVAAGICEPARYRGRFGPDEAISRLEMARLIVRTMRRGIEDPPAGAAEGRFPDTDGLSGEDRGYVQGAVDAGIITGYPDGTFRPEAAANRAEATVMLQRMVLGEPLQAALHLQDLAPDAATILHGFLTIELEHNHFIALSVNPGATDVDVIVGLDAQMVKINEFLPPAEQELGQFIHVPPEDLVPTALERFPEGIFVVAYGVTSAATDYIRLPPGLEGAAEAVQRMGRAHPEILLDLVTHWGLQLDVGHLILWKKPGIPGPGIMIAFAAQEVSLEPGPDEPGQAVFVTPEDILAPGDVFAAGAYVISDNPQR